MTTGLLPELTQHKRTRDQLLDRAVAQSKFPASRRAHYAALYDRDPKGTRALIERLVPVPVAKSSSQGTGLI